MRSRLKLRIRPLDGQDARRQTAVSSLAVSAMLRRRAVPVQALVQAVQARLMPSRASVLTSSASACSRNLATSRRGHRVAVQARFQSLEPESCQHQQPRDQRHEQPGHKGEVNTARSQRDHELSPVHAVVPVRSMSGRLSTLTFVTVPKRARERDGETRHGLVRRARRMNRDAGAGISARVLRAGLHQPARADGGDDSVGAEHR